MLVEQHAEIALSLTQNAVVIERGTIVHRARSADLLTDHATLDRLIGLRLAERAGQAGLTALRKLWQRFVRPKPPLQRQRAPSPRKRGEGEAQGPTA